MAPHAVITGSNRGIGLALAQHYAAAGFGVTGICRSASLALRALAQTVIDGVDLIQSDSIAQVCSRLSQRPIDLLLNVAGVIH